MFRKSIMGSGGKVPCFLNLGTTMEMNGQFISAVALSQTRLCRRLSEPQKQSMLGS
jgi:hypothetical protein